MHITIAFNGMMTVSEFDELWLIPAWDILLFCLVLYFMITFDLLNLELALYIWIIQLLNLAKLYCE